MTTNTGGLAANGAVPKQIVGYNASGGAIYGGAGTLSGGTLANNYGSPAPTVQHATPTTPVKSIVSPDGSTTTYHAPAQLPPDDPSNKYNTATGQLNPNYKDPNASQQTQAGLINPQSGVNANGSISSSQYTPPNQGTAGISQGGLIGNAVGQSQSTNQNALTAANNLNALGLGGNDSPQVQAAIKDLQDLQNKYAGNTKNIAQTAGFLTQQGGEQALQNSQYSTLLSAAQNRLQNALTQQSQQITASTNAGSLGNQTQGLQQSALGTAIGANAPVYGVGYGTQVGNPSAPGGGIQTGLNGVDMASNIASIQNYTQKINDINSQSDAINNNFSRAINYATTAGLTGNSPLWEGFKNKFGASFLTNPAVVGFNQAVGALNTQLQAFGETPIDINTATRQTLLQAQETVKKDLLTQKNNLESEKQKLLNSGGSNSSSDGSTGGASTDYKNGGAF